MSDVNVSDFNLAELTRMDQDEVARQMSICNACRYCEGLCAVFPAMELRRAFDGTDVDYLSNLCHNCGACYDACQYAPPHEFGINVPQAMADLRENSYPRYVWPAAFSGLFTRNAFWIGLAAVTFVAAFIAGVIGWHTAGAMFATHTGNGAFYRLIPHGILVAIFGTLLGYAILAMALSVRRFWRATHGGEPLAAGSIRQAIHDTATLRYLHGGGPGCTGVSGRPSDHRRWCHHATAYGFVLCLASTSLATVCHYLGYEAPYPVWHPVVILGVLGGIGLIAGPIGLLTGRPASARGKSRPADIGLVFIVMLLATSASGLAVLILRATPLMGLALTLHLGIVAALFVSLPYGKFVHGLHRVAALVRHAHEQRAAARG
ncbi:tricarballylate utilization 4Fe-4S protein TcuB [Salinisphaera sp. SWV1]|uniref:tricarballylate utilization 4Fe-4S protein TcuB n=1 Tax=Salinisphaera sp. SWV1 TaxID=3454139 RepID=UPI003F847E02